MAVRVALLCSIVVAVAAVVASVSAQDELAVRAPVRAQAAAVDVDGQLDDCLCQCSRLTYLSYSERRGNCRTLYKGARWCYVRNVYGVRSRCLDLQPSRRFPGRYWSSHACATPSLQSPQCLRVLPFFSASGSGGNSAPPLSLRSDVELSDESDDADDSAAEAVVFGLNDDDIL